MLKVEKIKKSFGNVEVLKDISFSLEKGEVLSIIGSSGSGKTTLLRCLNFLETAEQGKIFVDDDLLVDFATDLSQKDSQLRQKRLNFGLVFQSFNLFPQYSILKNLTLAVQLLEEVKKNNKEKLSEIDNRAIELLKRVGLEEKINSYPCELSGGQQQRVAIARALMLSPKILCFDEPTSALDPELTGEVLRVIRELRDGNTTMIIVTHEMNFAKNVSDKVIFMADGIIEEIGTPTDLFENPKSQRLKEFLSSSLKD
ncbi:MAG: amino acid ABC transporter ATP-binding protein [Clostridia bacterium]|nr:amino acid ABC transporter ATP-binding protein [Clostridia bacterium]